MQTSPASSGRPPAGQLMPTASSTIGAVALASLAPSSEIPFITPRTKAETVDGSDRAFFLKVLAGLTAATVACGVIAISGVVAISLP